MNRIGLYTVVPFLLAVGLGVNSAYAAFFTPTSITGPEGDVIEVDLTIETADWVDISGLEGGTSCSDSGFDFEFNFGVTLENGSATWGEDLTVNDSLGQDFPGLIMINGQSVCSTSNAQRNIAPFGTFTLFEDNKAEDTETAIFHMDYCKPIPSQPALDGPLLYDPVPPSPPFDCKYRLSIPITIEDTNTPTVSISAIDAEAAETKETETPNPGLFRISVDDGTPVTSPVNVLYGIGGRAENGVDYKEIHINTATIPVGATYVEIPIDVINDQEIEGVEAVRLALGNGTGYFVNGLKNEAEVRIEDNDPEEAVPVPSVGIRKTSDAREGGNPDGAFEVFITNDNPRRSTPVTVGLSVDASSTATSGVDFVALPNQVILPPGQSRVSVPVVALDDDDFEEGNEFVKVSITPPAGFLPEDGGSATVNILDNTALPPAGMIVFDMDDYEFPEPARGGMAEATVTLKRMGGSRGSISATFKTLDSDPATTAESGADYTPKEVQLDWANGDESVREVPITVFGNGTCADLANYPETVKLQVVAGAESPAVARLQIQANPATEIQCVPLVVDPTTPPGPASVADAIVESCLKGAGLVSGGVLNSPDFQVLCTNLRGAEDVKSVVEQLAPNDPSAPGNAGKQTTMVQTSAVAGRLGILKGGGGAGFSASGFSLSRGDVNVSGDLIRSFVSSFDQNNPDFMNANGQDDDTGYLDEFGRWGAWISGRMVFGEKDASQQVSDSYEFDTAGITFGLDYQFSDKFVAGVAAGYSNTDVDIGFMGDTLDTKGYSVAVYGTYFEADRFYLGGSVGYGSNSYDQLRNIDYKSQGISVEQQLGADFDGSQYSLSLNGGRDFFKNGWTFGPIFGVDYVDVDVDAYDERLINSSAGGTGWAVHMASQNYSSLQPNIGFEISNAFSQSWGVFFPTGYIKVVSELDDGPRLVNGRFLGDNNDAGFELITDDFEETFARAGVGFGFQLKNNKSAFLTVDGDFGRDLLSVYYINAGFRWQF